MCTGRETWIKYMDECVKHHAKEGHHQHVKGAHYEFNKTPETHCRQCIFGSSTQDVHERIKNAATDPTYLEAPVRVLAVMDCFNLNPQKFKNLIHAFLHQQRLNMTLINAAGKPYHPEEWFAVELETAVEVCERIADGTIAEYRMDNVTGSIVKKG